MITASRGAAARLGMVPPMHPAERPRPGNRVLVPVIWGQSAAPLLSIGDAIADDCPSRGVVLSLVEISTRRPGIVTSAVMRSREQLRWIAASDYDGAGRTERLSIESRFTSDPGASIREALLETDCDTVVVEYPPDNGGRRHRLDSILRVLAGERRVNLVVARPDPSLKSQGVRPRSVLVPVRGGANAWFALSVGMAVASRAEARLVLLHVYDPAHHRDLRRHEAATFRELALAARSASPEIQELDSDNPAETMLELARGHDAVVVGAHANPARSGMLVGPMLSWVIKRLPSTVIVTRAAIDPQGSVA
jgi:nucleotide-binding universal stress UspA family protein